MPARPRLWTVVKVILLSVVVLLVLGFSAFVGMLFLWEREMSGKWPGKPLKRFANELELSNGGTLAIHSTESRSWGETGFDSKIRYRPAGEDGWEDVGGWYSHSMKPMVKGFRDTLIVIPPDGQRVFLRPSSGPWWQFSLWFLHEREAARLGEQSARNGIPAEDILPIRQSVDAEEQRWAPSFRAREFDQESGVLTVEYRTNRTRIISFRLDADGTRFRYFGIRSEG